MLGVKFIVGIFVVGHTSDFAHQHARPERAHTQLTQCIFIGLAFTGDSLCVSLMLCGAVPCRLVFSRIYNISVLGFGSGADFEFFFPFSLHLSLWFCWHILETLTLHFFREATKIYVILYIQFRHNLSMLICFFCNIYFVRNLFNALLENYLWRKRGEKKIRAVYKFITLSLDGQDAHCIHCLWIKWIKCRLVELFLCSDLNCLLELFDLRT